MISGARQKIIEVTEQLCSVSGPSKMTLDQVAAGAKIGKGTIYRHFRSKDDLLYKTIEHRMEELYENTSVKIDISGDDFLKGVKTVFKELKEFFNVHNTIVAMSYYLSNDRIRDEHCNENDPFVLLASVLNRLLIPLVIIGMKQQLLRADVPPNIMSMQLASLIQMSSRLSRHSIGYELSDEVLIKLFIEGAGI